MRLGVRCFVLILSLVYGLAALTYGAGWVDGATADSMPGSPNTTVPVVGRNNELLTNFWASGEFKESSVELAKAAKVPAALNLWMEKKNEDNPTFEDVGKSLEVVSQCCQAGDSVCFVFRPNVKFKNEQGELVSLERKHTILMECRGVQTCVQL